MSNSLNHSFRRLATRRGGLSLLTATDSVQHENGCQMLHRPGQHIYRVPGQPPGNWWGSKGTAEKADGGNLLGNTLWQCPPAAAILCEVACLGCDGRKHAQECATAAAAAPHTSLAATATGDRQRNT